MMSTFFYLICGGALAYVFGVLLPEAEKANERYFSGEGEAEPIREGMVRFILDADQLGRLTVYRGDCTDEGLFYVEKGSIYGSDSYVIRDYFSHEAVYTVIPLSGSEKQYVVKEGYSQEGRTVYCIDAGNAGGFMYVMEGSFHGRVLYRIRQGKTYMYIAEEYE